MHSEYQFVLPLPTLTIDPTLSIDAEPSEIVTSPMLILPSLELIEHKEEEEESKSRSITLKRLSVSNPELIQSHPGFVLPNKAPYVHKK